MRGASLSLRARIRRIFQAVADPENTDRDAIASTREIPYLSPTLRRFGNARVAKALYERVGDIFLGVVVRHTDNFADVTWLGHPIWQNVLDLWTLQEAIAEIRPAIILETGTNRGGSAMFYANLLDLIGEGRVVTVDIEQMHHLVHPRIEFLIGSSVSDEILARMKTTAQEAKGPVMVVLDSDHRRDHVAAELEHYAPLVTSGSLILVQDGIVDAHRIFTAGRPGPGPAISAFLARHPEFYLDESWDRRFLATHHPGGWLRRR
jgi:cephalosporin hydroxylase